MEGMAPGVNKPRHHSNGNGNSGSEPGTLTPTAAKSFGRFSVDGTHTRSKNISESSDLPTPLVEEGDVFTFSSVEEHPDAEPMTRASTDSVSTDKTPKSKPKIAPAAASHSFAYTNEDILDLLITSPTPLGAEALSYLEQKHPELAAFLKRRRKQLSSFTDTRHPSLMHQSIPELWGPHTTKMIITELQTFLRGRVLAPKSLTHRLNPCWLDVKNGECVVPVEFHVDREGDVETVYKANLSPLANFPSLAFIPGKQTGHVDTYSDTRSYYDSCACSDVVLQLQMGQDCLPFYSTQSYLNLELENISERPVPADAGNCLDAHLSKLAPGSEVAVKALLNPEVELALEDNFKTVYHYTAERAAINRAVTVTILDPETIRVDSVSNYDQYTAQTHKGSKNQAQAGRTDPFR